MHAFSTSKSNSTSGRCSDEEYRTYISCNSESTAAIKKSLHACAHAHSMRSRILTAFVVGETVLYIYNKWKGLIAIFLAVVMHR